MQILVDSRFAARGLGIATVTDRLIAALEGTPDIAVRRWQAEASWGRRAKLQTIARSGVFDVSPVLDRRTRPWSVVHYMSNICSVFPGAASVMTVHDLMNRGRRRDRMMASFRRAGLQRVGRLVATTQRGFADLVDLGFPVEQLECIPFGMRTQRETSVAREHVLTFAGSADPRKRVHLAIRGYAAYRRRCRDALPLVVLGRAGINPAHREMLAGVDARIIEDPSGAEVDRLLEGAAVLLYPTRVEGFGLPLVEAAECSTAVVVASDADLPREVLGQHITRAPADNAEAWGEVIDALIRRGVQPNACLALKTWPEVAASYARVYREVRPCPHIV